MYISSRWYWVAAIAIALFTGFQACTAGHSATIDFKGNRGEFNSLSLEGREITSWDEIEGSDAEGVLSPDNAILDNAFIDNSTIDNSTIDNSTIDNTPIGSTTPSSGRFTTLATDNATNDEISYLSGLSGNIQLQLDLKAPLADPTFTGSLIVVGEIVGQQFTSDAANGEHYINVANSIPPNSGTEELGDCYYDNGSLAWLCWSGSAYTPPSFTSVPVGDNTAVDAYGKLGIDNTDDQFLYGGYDNTPRVLTPRRTEPIVVKGYSAADDNAIELYYSAPVTISKLSCRTAGTDNVTVTLYNCNASGASCGATGFSVAATSTRAEDLTFTDAEIAAGETIVLSLSSIVGTPTYLKCNIDYTYMRQ